MSRLLENYLYEIGIRRKNLEIKRQIQTAENNKEEAMLCVMESMLESLKEGDNKNE